MSHAAEGCPYGHIDGMCAGEELGLIGRDDVLEGVMHAPDSIYPYHVAVAEALVDLADEADIPLYLMRLDEP